MTQDTSALCRDVLDVANRFGTRFLAPRDQEIEDADAFFPDLVEKAGEMGLLALALSEQYGGAQAGAVATSLATISAASISPAVANVLGAIRLHAYLLEKYGTDEQKARWLAPIAMGKKIGGFAITEPQAGSDVSAIRTLARRDGTDFVINGSKQFISLAPVCDMMIVLASTDPAAGSRGQTCFIVERGCKGLSIGPKEPMMGQRGVPVSAVYFEDCRVHESAVLGALGGGFKIMMDGLDGTRLDIAAIALGISRTAFAKASDYAATRTQFGKPIAAFQGVGFMLAQMLMEIEAGELLLMQAARTDKSDRHFTRYASMAKAFCADNAMRHATDAVQVFGGTGFTKRAGVERLMRDAKICQIYDGTSQIHQWIIARSILDDTNKGLSALSRLEDLIL